VFIVLTVSRLAIPENRPASYLKAMVIGGDKNLRVTDSLMRRAAFPLEAFPQQ
jgi:hypothetical protein